ASLFGWCSKSHGQQIQQSPVILWDERGFSFAVPMPLNGPGAPTLLMPLDSHPVPLPFDSSGRMFSAPALPALPDMTLDQPYDFGAYGAHPSSPGWGSGLNLEV